MANRPEATTSSDLLRRAQAGDQQALSDLVELYLPRLRRWATGRIPEGARSLLETQDLVQETVIAAIRNLPRFEIYGDGAFQAYLRRALANRLNDLYRRAKRHPEADGLPSDLPAHTASPLEEAIGAEALTRYEVALGRLTDVDQQAVLLRIELCCSYDEIATALQKSSASHARMAVSRALTRLAREMSNVRH